MAPYFPSGDEPFADAQQRWQLASLYSDLAIAKGRGLTPVEKTYLRGLLCGYSPTEMATQLQVKNDSIRNTLSRGLYRYLETLLSQDAEDIARVDSWAQVPRLLQQQGYALLPPEVPVNRDENATSASTCPTDPLLMGVPEAPHCDGREADLALVQGWMQRDRCRLILLFGMGGIGKTTLAAHLLKTVQQDFEVVVWRSLRASPEPDTFFRALAETLWRAVSDPPPVADLNLSAVLAFMHQHRCLLILEDVQTTFQQGALAGQYADGYAPYGEFLRRVGEEPHQSCILLTSWEKPREVVRQETPEGPVRCHRLKGLPLEASRELLHRHQLQDVSLWDELIRPYRGNPLALNIVATTIRDLFSGSVATLLNQDTLFLGDLNYLLHQQLSRLSNLEREIVEYLAATRTAVTLKDLRTQIPSPKPWSDWLAAVESLHRRALLERLNQSDAVLLSLQPVVARYLLKENPAGKGLG